MHHDQEMPTALAPGLSITMAINSADDASRVAFAEQVINGTQPFTDDFLVPASVPPDVLLPPGFRTVVDLGGSIRRVVARQDEACVQVQCYPQGTAVDVSAATASTLAELVRDIQERATAALGEATQHLEVNMWWSSGRSGAARSSRLLQVEQWTDVSRNYPCAVRARLDAFMGSAAPTGTARLVLWHGEPGTGKTTAVLALLEAWRDWCCGHVIADPEKMFADPKYLHEVFGSDADSLRYPGIGRDRDRSNRWKLIVAEDADGYLRSDARARSGPALGRLLNASDGIMGRGSRTIILLTTNDPISRLHPAITRPGRCLSMIEFTRFSRTEAAVWLDCAAPPPEGGATLAELFHLRDGAPGAGLEQSPPPSIGAYL